MLTQENFGSVIDEVMHGAIDMHVHFAPDQPPADDLRVARRLDALGTARQAREAGMRAVVLKSHHWPTGALVRTIQPLVPEIALFGTVVLNYSIGGLNPFAVEVAARIGCKFLFAPTWQSAYHVSGRRSRNEGPIPAGLRGRKGITILDDNGRLVPEMHEILEIAKASDMVVATGHVSPQEHRVLVEEAHRRGLQRIVVSHVRDDLSLEDRKRMADQGAVIELVYRPTMDPRAIIEAARGVGVEHCAMTVDGGQAFKPLPAEEFRAFVGQLLYHGMSPEEVKVMAQKVPARVLGLS
ncbi:MAG TPA: DUF6282 family protein [candidate division Zixibacteria bacterium]|nr:DUF6282 family protein [candidate division Zixibacteria bacterium]